MDADKQPVTEHNVKYLRFGKYPIEGYLLSIVCKLSHDELQQTVSKMRLPFQQNI